MAKKKVTNAREQEILNYRIDRGTEQIEFYEDHGLSQRKIDKLINKKTRNNAKLVKVKNK